MSEQHAQGTETLGTGELDVVRAQHLEHGVAHDQHRRDQIERGNRQRRQYQVVQEVGGRKERPGTAGIGTRGEHAAGRKQLDLIAETDEQQNADHEGWGRLKHQSDHRRADVECAAPARGHQNPEHDAQRDGHDESGSHQQQRVDQPMAQQIRHRLAACE